MLGSTKYLKRYNDPASSDQIVRLDFHTAQL
ncbi:hypothetical protein V6Z12_D12G034300 [Gossypium hirsutum]